MTAAWTVSAQVEVVRSWGSFMIPKITLGLFAYLVAREVQRAANSVYDDQYMCWSLIWTVRSGAIPSFVGPP